MDSIFTAFEYIQDYHALCSRDLFEEFTFIHHDKKRKVQNMSAQVGNDKQLLAILAHAQKLNADGFNVFYGTCPRTHTTKRGSRGTEADVNTIPAFWIEIDSVKEHRDPKADAARLMSSDTPPTYYILSGGGVHAYWVLNEPHVMTDIDRHDIKQTLKGLAKLHGGDTAVAEFARVLRVPGFVNTKPERHNALVECVYPEHSHLYTLADMLKFKLEAPVHQPYVTSHVTPEDLQATAEAALEVLSNARRDDREAWLEVLMCLKEGLGDAGFALADSWSSRSPKYEGIEDIQRTWDSLKRHDKTIATLFFRADEDFGSSRWRPRQITIDVLPAKLPDWSVPLTVGERGAIYRYLEPTEAAIIDTWTASGIGEADIEFLACISGLTERKIRLAMNRLPMIFLTFDDIINLIQEGATLDPCKEAFRTRKSGRPKNLYRLADRSILHTELLKLAIPQIVKAAFPAKDPLVAPIQKAFLVELGLDDDEAQAKAEELDKRYGKELAKQPGWRQRMQEVRREVFDLKLSLSGKRIMPDGEPDVLCQAVVPLPTGMPLGKRIELLAASARALIEHLGGTFQMGRDRLCKLIGCRLTELAAVCRAAGIARQKHVKVSVPVKIWPELMERCAKRYDPEIGGSPILVQSTLEDKPVSVKFKGLGDWAVQQIKRMGKLSVIYQCANCYTLEKPVEPEPTPEPEPKPESVQPTLFNVVTTAVRFWNIWLQVFIFERIYSIACIIWCFLRHITREAKKVLTYAENWLNKTVELATPWQPQGDRLIERTTGEIQPASVQLSFDLLLADPSPG